MGPHCTDIINIVPTSCVRTTAYASVSPPTSECLKPPDARINTWRLVHQGLVAMATLDACQL